VNKNKKQKKNEKNIFIDQKHKEKTLENKIVYAFFVQLYIRFIPILRFLYN